MGRPPKARVTKKIRIHMYSELWHASLCVFEAGLREKRGSSWQFLSSAVLAAFAFEAYLNHTGAQLLECWPSLERLPPMSKFALLCETLKVKFPQGKGSRPLGTIEELMEFRNTMAHGRTETVVLESKLRDINEKLDNHLGEVPLAHWQSLIKTADFAQKARADVEARILTQLHEARPEPKEPLFTFGLGEHSATVESASH